MRLPVIRGVGPLLAALALAALPAIAQAQVAPARCASEGPGPCTKWEVIISPGAVETDEHAYLSWSKQQWASGLASCRAAGGTTIRTQAWPFGETINVAHGLCGRIFAVETLCRSPNAGRATAQQCERWGLRSASVATEVDPKVVFDAARDFFIKLAEAPELRRVAVVEAMVDVGANTALKEFTKAGLGEGCANQLDAVVKDFNPPKSGLSAAAATAEAIPMLIDALLGLKAAVNVIISDMCVVTRQDLQEYAALAPPPEVRERCHRFRQKWTQEQAIRVAERMIADLKGKYACDVPKR